MKIYETHTKNKDIFITIKTDYFVQSEVKYILKVINIEIDKFRLEKKSINTDLNKKGFNKWLGGRIKQKRELLNLSLEQLSEKSGLNLCKSTMSQIENGKQNLSTYQYIKIKSILDKEKLINMNKKEKALYLADKLSKGETVARKNIIQCDIEVLKTELRRIKNNSAMVLRQLKDY